MTGGRSMGKTKIEWATDSWNPIRARRLSVQGPSASLGWHCEKVSAGCANCYAETMNKRLGTGLEFKPGNREKIELFLDEKMLLAPLHWRTPRRIFVCSMTDLFAGFVPDEWIDRMFGMMARCPQQVFQVLTKRPARMRTYCSDSDTSGRVWTAALKFRGCTEPWPLPNVWLGTSCEDQATYDERYLHLRATPAAIRFFSFEPLLAPIKAEWLGDWCIVGGESGHGARPMHAAWARALRDQCASAGVPLFFKQWGEWAFLDGWENWSYAREPQRHDWPDGETSMRVGKKRAGRLLDGVEHSEFPK